MKLFSQNEFKNIFHFQLCKTIERYTIPGSIYLQWGYCVILMRRNVHYLDTVSSHLILLLPKKRIRSSIKDIFSGILFKPLLKLQYTYSRVCFSILFATVLQHKLLPTRYVIRSQD